MHKVNFSKNQKLPAGYEVYYSEYDEHYYWYYRKGKEGEKESLMFSDRWQAYRSAWAHFNAIDLPF